MKAIDHITEANSEADINDLLGGEVGCQGIVDGVVDRLALC